MKKLYLLWVLVFLGICVGGVVSAGAKIGWFLNIPSFIIVVAPALILSLSNFSPAEISRYFAIGFSKTEVNDTDLKNSIAFFKALQSYFILSGIMGTMIGFIVILGSLDDKAAIGSGMACALLTILYAVILIIAIVIPFRTGLQKKLN